MKDDSSPQPPELSRRLLRAKDRMDGENPGALRARGNVPAHDVARVPACVVSVAHRPDLTMAVSEKRRRGSASKNGRSEPKEVR